MTKQIALIAGASRRLGRNKALHPAKRGVGIIGTYRSGKIEADALRQEIVALGGKAAMITFRVNAIAPGAIATDFNGGAARDNEGLNAFVTRGIALGRVGRPDDIGGAVAAILSDEMGWATGTTFDVSGGQLL